MEALTIILRDKAEVQISEIMINGSSTGKAADNMKPCFST